MQDNVAELLQSLKTTKGSRFNAAKRLGGRDKQMAALIALASTLVIALTVLPFIYHFRGTLSNDISATTVAMSVLILVFSLLQYSNNDAVTAEQHHRCGLEINELRREVRAKAEELSVDEVLEFGNRFDRILQKYSINHDDVDFDKYQMEHLDEYPLGILARLWAILRINFSTYWPTGVAFMIGLIGIYFLFRYVLPARF